jgi:hypothetical protein
MPQGVQARVFGLTGLCHHACGDLDWR